MEEKKLTMPKELGTRWLEALRSGNYKQGRGRLLSRSGVDGDEEYNFYCCIGVLAVVMNKVINEDGTNVDGEEGSYYPFLLNSLMGSDKDKTNFRVMLVNKNDGKGLPFKDIANYIEETVEFI